MIGFQNARPRPAVWFFFFRINFIENTAAFFKDLIFTKKPQKHSKF